MLPEYLIMQNEAMNKLEQSIVDWISVKTQNPALTAQIGTASIKRRDYMRTGFFVYLDSDPACDVVPSGVKLSCPHISSPELRDGAGCNLFLRNGRLHYLEIYARGGFIPESMELFELLRPDQ
jgi:hypothetical protein